MSTTTISSADADSFMKQLRGYIVHDIGVAITGNANYLAALGLSAYTEVLGGLYNGSLRNNLGANFTRFIHDYFPASYRSVDANLMHLNGIYGAVRSGLTHEYFVKKKSQVVMDSSTPLICGIIYEPAHTIQVTFIVKKYFEDFKNAFDKYHIDLIQGPNSNVLLNTFERALRSVNSSFLNDPGNFAATSGTTYTGQFGSTW